MELLQGGVDRAVIALWLGHESVETTQIYLDADLALKEEALAKTNPVKGGPKRFQRMIVSNQTPYSEGLEPLRSDPRGIVRDAA